MAESDGKKFLIRLYESNALLILLALSFLAFLITKSVIFAVITGVLILSLFVLDIVAGVQRHGFSKEIMEVGIAVAIALVAWFGISFILNTSSPISAIVSCSMLPSFERGDMIILQGVPPSEIKAPEAAVDSSMLDAVLNSTHVPCGSTAFGLDYLCASCIRLKPGQATQEIYVKCARGLAVSGRPVNENLTNDVIVYTPRPSLSSFKGDIIHRVFAKLTDGNRTVFLTKGDNNDYFDSSMFGAVPQETVKGKVLLRIPYLGYLKLFISGFFTEPGGCDTVLQH